MQESTHPTHNPAYGARFDWYAATIQDDPQAVTDVLESGLEAEPVKVKPKHGYTVGVDFRRDDRLVASLLYGGTNGAPHAWASSDDAPRFASLVRSCWPGEHHVTRFDSAVDFAARPVPYARPWDLLYPTVLRVASNRPGRPIRLSTIGDWITPGAPLGRTLYVGSFKSPVLVRLYEKGKQLANAAPPGMGAKYSPDWVRLEAQVRPEKDARYRAAHASPSDVWGFSRWTKDLAAAALNLHVERVPTYEDREADDDRAMAYLLRQYGKVLGRSLERLGTWEAVGAELGARLATLEDGAQIPFVRNAGEDNKWDYDIHAGALRAVVKDASEVPF